MKPRQDPKQANFDWARRHDPHVPEIVVVHRSDVNRPDGSRRGNQTAKPFFSAHAQPTAFALGTLGWLVYCDNRNELILRADIALAAGIPIDISVLV